MIFIGICGPSNSGKSSLCEELIKKYDAGWIEVDHYIKDKKDIPFKGKYRNWELPKNHRFDKLLADLKKLSSDKTISHPIYSWKKGKVKGDRKIKPKKIIFIEGFYLFSDKKIRDMLDVKIYLNITSKELRKRRTCNEEGYEWDKREYLDKVYFPMYQRYGITQKEYADYIINANVSLQEVEEKVKKIVESKLHS
ncbi:hypothetical protein GOV13_01755 [Candidatus Pacearchaeota archaeon]|nr:hypothetical protein [Candidatus Pacearchaeota archaeon]